MISKRVARGALAALAALAIAACTQSDPEADGRMLAAPEDWPSWGRTPGEQHYSPLDQINRGTVGRLALAWHYDLPSENTATGPVAADGKLFITSGHSYIRALDAASGELLWEFNSRTREQSRAMRLGFGPKGLAYWNGRVFLGTEDGRIIALDANTGAQLWEQRDFAPSELRNMSGPVRVFDGKLIIGHGGADLSPVRGYVTAYDAMSGERLWRFHTIPDFAQPPENQAENAAMRIAAPTWPGARAGVSGGGTAWNAFSYDPELNLFYIEISNGFPYNQAIRSPGGGDNLFLASIVAVNADTGEYVWHYQVCPGEQWDCVATMDIESGDAAHRRPRTQSADPGAEERFCVRDRPRQWPADFRRSVRNRDLGVAHRFGDRPPGGKSRRTLSWPREFHLLAGRDRRAFVAAASLQPAHEPCVHSGDRRRDHHWRPRHRP